MSLSAALERIAREFAPAALGTSLQAEGIVLLDAVARAGLPVEVFMLDTGRLHADTLNFLREVEDRYRLQINIYRPDPAAVSAYVRAHGRDGFYSNLDLRKRCCEIRKLEPLARALAGKRAWITGQRREQSVTRAALAEQEYDSRHGIEKFNPLAGWSESEVWSYLRASRAPYNRLYDQGYRSIGCAPCTRPVLPGEEMRAGRWWWELAEHRECGLHAPRRKVA
jgi:phosphoadenosine phosphosulfate reductase